MDIIGASIDIVTMSAELIEKPNFQVRNKIFILRANTKAKFLDVQQTTDFEHGGVITTTVKWHCDHFG